MKNLNKNTKKAQHFVNEYARAEYSTVNAFYKKPSYNKVCAEQKIFERMKNNGGYDYRVLSGNCSTFTAGYKTKSALIIETAYNTYIIEFYGC